MVLLLELYWCLHIGPRLTWLPADCQGVNGIVICYIARGNEALTLAATGCRQIPDSLTKTAVWPPYQHDLNGFLNRASQVRILPGPLHPQNSTAQ